MNRIGRQLCAVPARRSAVGFELLLFLPAAAQAKAAGDVRVVRILAAHGRSGRQSRIPCPSAARLWKPGVIRSIGPCEASMTILSCRRSRT